MLTYCAYQGCTVQNVPFSKITFFSLPKDERRKIWIVNSGNQQLQHISPTATRFFCEHHFHPKYLKRQFHRTTLHKTAIPFKYKNPETENEISNVSSDEEIEINEAPRKKKARSSFFVVVPSNQKENDEQHNGKEKKRIRTAQNSTRRNDLLRHYVETEQDEMISLSSDIDYANLTITKLPILHKDATEIDENISQESVTLDLEETMELNEHNNGKKDEKECIVNVNNISCKNVDINVAVEQQKAAEKSEQEDHMMKATKVAFKDKLVKIDGKKQDLTSYERKILFNGEENIVSSESSIDYQADKHFALSLVEYFHKLPSRKRQMAKLKILQYLTELQYGNDTTIS